MIFLVVGVFLTILGCLFLFIPSKGNLPFYGYHSPRATKSDVHWRLAQKTSGKYFFIFGLLMALIGYLLKLTVLVFPIMPIFILTEKKLQELDDSIGGNKK